VNTLFISDLHLEDSKPQTTALLTDFLRGPATKADAVYILGDLFEFWIGDDVLSRTAQRVADKLAELHSRGVPCYFLHGNRDFLVGPDYAERAGLQLLPQTFVADIYGTPTLLLHGDTLCTGDLEYQDFRQRVRTQDFADRFLQLPTEQRQEMAHNARDASKQHTASRAAADIMDVNEIAVRNAFLEHGIRRMIHGHTHRPAIHQHQLGAGVIGQRLVLSDWHSSGNYLRVDPQEYELLTLAGTPLF
jgi:UDP-2,3-diacylglucosamine hydrolase